MTEEPFTSPHDPGADDIPAADPGSGAPQESPGFGDGVAPDVYPDPDPEGDTLEEELQDRPAPPFRTPRPSPAPPADDVLGHDSQSRAVT